MPTQHKYPLALAGIFSILLLLSLSAQATEFHGGYGGVVATNVPSQATALRVNGPNDLHMESEDFSIATDDGLPDGSYTYEILGRLKKDPEKTASTASGHPNSGREEGARPELTPIGTLEYGYFRIAGGVVVTGAEEE